MTSPDPPRTPAPPPEHTHEPVMAVWTCGCGERAVWRGNDDQLEACDQNWSALDKFFDKNHRAMHPALPHDQRTALERLTEQLDRQRALNLEAAAALVGEAKLHGEIDTLRDLLAQATARVAELERQRDSALRSLYLHEQVVEAAREWASISGHNMPFWKECVATPGTCSWEKLIFALQVLDQAHAPEQDQQSRL